MSNYCNQCGKKATTKRTVYNGGGCSDCSDEPTDVSLTLPHKAGDTLGSIKVEEFINFMNSELLGKFRQIIHNEYTALIKPIQDEVETLKTEVKSLKTKLATAETDITDLKGKLQTLTAECETEKKVSADNLKYLISHDRNYRQQNLVLLGVPDRAKITLGEEEFDNDEGVVSHILGKVGVDEDVAILETFRLGKKPDDADEDDEDESPRPIKVRLADRFSVSTALKNSYKLKNQFGELKIFLKPDKTKSEREEYGRLGKRKAELLKQYPTPESGVPRVLLTKGKLLVDNAQVDEYRSTQSLF